MQTNDREIAWLAKITKAFHEDSMKMTRRVNVHGLFT